MRKKRTLKDTPAKEKFQRAVAEQALFKSSLGIRLREVMAENDITICELGKILHYSESQIRRWLTPKGRHAPIEFYLYFCFVYDVSPTYLFWGIGPRRISHVANFDQINTKLDLLVTAQLYELDNSPD